MPSLYVMIYQYMVSALVFEAAVLLIQYTSFVSEMEFCMQCEDRRCRIWQHVSCVIIPEKPIERGSPPVFPETFFCGLCRLSRADP